MGQKYKIFINDKILFLAQNPAEVEEILSTEDQYIIQPFKDLKRLKSMLEILLGKINRSNMVLYHADLENLKKVLFSQFEYIEAAGGVVRNELGQILLIHRKGSWDLPKGKMEGNETLEKTAVREVKEETGIDKASILAPITFPGLTNDCTFHTYRLADQNILKASYWYQMETSFTGRLVPQKIEDIDKAVWVEESDLTSYFPEMYPSIVDVLKAARTLGRTIPSS
jgi:8-oxo-dGTP pyrophosphatase MutT (NUDIX family)